jgi:hypothetical protein
MWSTGEVTAWVVGDGKISDAPCGFASPTRDYKSRTNLLESLPHMLKAHVIQMECGVRLRHIAEARSKQFPEFPGTHRQGLEFQGVVFVLPELVLMATPDWIKRYTLF